MILVALFLAGLALGALSCAIVAVASIVLWWREHRRKERSWPVV